MSRNIREIAWENGYQLPTNAETQRIALYNWFEKSKYVVKTDDNTYVFGDSRTGARYKVSNGKLIEQHLGIIR